GDRYVMEKMRQGGYNLGGEQSGHIIFLDYNTTGDGLLSALQLINVMKETDKPLSELAEEMTLYPQVLKNVEVTNKEDVLKHPQSANNIENVEQQLGNEDSILVRTSGTEPLIRVMVEAPSEEECEQYVNEVVQVVEKVSGENKSEERRVGKDCGKRWTTYQYMISLDKLIDMRIRSCVKDVRV